MRPDGTIFDAPGYVLRPASTTGRGTTSAWRRSRSGPTRRIRRSCSPLDEAVGEFPYEDGASAANTLALMLTHLCARR